MCLGAIYWARLDALYYANTKEDAAAIAFDDAFIYQELDLSAEERKLRTKQVLNDEALLAFEKWRQLEDKMEY